MKYLHSWNASRLMAHHLQFRQQAGDFSKIEAYHDHCHLIIQHECQQIAIKLKSNPNVLVIYTKLPLSQPQQVLPTSTTITSLHSIPYHYPELFIVKVPLQVPNLNISFHASGGAKMMHLFVYLWECTQGLGFQIIL